MSGSGIIALSAQSADLAKQLENCFQTFYDGAYRDIENYINKSAELWEGDAANEAISKARQYMAELNIQREKTLAAAVQISKNIDFKWDDVHNAVNNINQLEF